MAKDNIVLGEQLKLDALKRYQSYMEELENRIKVEKDIERETKTKVEYHYLTVAMYELYDMLTRYEQFGQYLLRPDESYKRVRQVIRSRKYIPKGILHLHKPEHTVIDSLYLVADIYLLDSKLVKDYIRKGTSVDDAHELGLPPSSKVNYGTSKSVNSTTHIALARDSWVSDYIIYSSQYDYPTLDLIKEGVVNYGDSC